MILKFFHSSYGKLSSMAILQIEGQGFVRLFCRLFTSKQEKDRSDGVVDRASASEAVDAGSIIVSGQAEDFRKLAFTASLPGVQH